MVLCFYIQSNLIIHFIKLSSAFVCTSKNSANFVCLQSCCIVPVWCTRRLCFHFSFGIHSIDWETCVKTFNRGYQWGWFEKTSFMIDVSDIWRRHILCSVVFQSNETFLKTLNPLAVGLIFYVVFTVVWFLWKIKIHINNNATKQKCSIWCYQNCWKFFMHQE